MELDGNSKISLCSNNRLLGFWLKYHCVVITEPSCFLPYGRNTVVVIVIVCLTAPFIFRLFSKNRAISHDTFRGGRKENPKHQCCCNEGITNLPSRCLELHVTTVLRLDGMFTNGSSLSFWEKPSYQV